MDKFIDEFIIKEAVYEDIPLILGFRKALFEESGHTNDFYVKNVETKTINFYEKSYSENIMRHFIAYNSKGEPVSVAGALIKNDFPYFLFSPGFYGWIVDVYTKPEFRKKGAASRLLDLSVEWSKNKGVEEIQLLAFSKEAIKIYKKAGFKDVNVMKLNLLNLK